MNWLDPPTRRFWRLTGRPIDLDGEHSWLRSPRNTVSLVNDSWVEAAGEQLGGPGGSVRRGQPDSGLMASMSDLDGPGFRAADLQPQVRDFYEHTSGWRMEVWAGWNPIFWPGGEIVSRLYGKRVGQLALPMRPLDVARGMDSKVDQIVDVDGRQVAAAWLRTLRATGDYVYSGCYRITQLPRSDRPSVHVSFPLEHGAVQVFLRPEVDPDGSLWLNSPGADEPKAFGANGCYMVAQDGAKLYAAKAPLNERFHVFTDEEGVLRTDHELRVGPAPAVRLHYKLERPSQPAA